MKKIITILIAGILVTGCVSKREVVNTANNNVSYNIKPETKSIVRAGRFWFLFIPIGFGPRKYEDRKEKVIHRFNRQNNCDAISGGQIIDRKIIIPLIIVSYSTHWTTLKGKPCILKTDSLKR